MASGDSAKSIISAEVLQGEPLGAQAGSRSSLNKAYRLEGANSTRNRSSRLNVLAATALLCAALFSVGLRFGRWGLLPGRFRESSDTGLSLGAGDLSTLSTIKTQEERIAALEESVEEAKHSLQRNKEWLTGLQKERDKATETAKLLRSAIEQLSDLEAKQRPADSSHHEERDKLIQAVESAKVKVNEDEAQKALDDQRKILQREEAIAARREEDVSDQSRQARVTHERKKSALKEAIASLVGAVEEHRIKLEAVTDAETHVKHLASTLENLKAKASKLEIDSGLQRWKNNVDDASLKNGLLREDFRKQQAGMLVSSHVRTRQLVREITKELLSFSSENLKHSGADLDRNEVLVERVWKVLKLHGSASELIPDQLATGWDIIRNTAAVKLGVSESLNNRQLAWELSQAKKVSQLEGKEMVWGWEGSEFETERLEALEEELRSRLASVLPCKKFPEENSAAQEEADFLLEDCRLDGNPECILVRGFKSVDSDETDQGVDVEFRVLRALGKGGSAVVVEVEPVDETLKEKVGTLAMKMLRQGQKPDQRQIEATMQKLEGVFQSEKNALRKIALEGESVAAVTQRTGVIGALYIGRVQGLYGAIKLSDSNVIVSFDDVTFSPIIASDVLNVFISNVAEGFSMESRVYIAHSLLRTVAHIHSAGVVHNDITINNVGITEDGRVVVFDCANFEKPGGSRTWFSPSSTSPESAELGRRGASRTGSFREDAWGLGYMLYAIFTEGVGPFQDTDPNFLDGIISKRAEKADRLMHNLESPSFQLRRYGVPDIWIRAISLLLERNGQHRPTVMQLLQAFPALRQGPFKALENEDKAL